VVQGLLAAFGAEVLGEGPAEAYVAARYDEVRAMLQRHWAAVAEIGELLPLSLYLYGATSMIYSEYPGSPAGSPGS
jgi:hypothetical protein